MSRRAWIVAALGIATAPVLVGVFTVVADEPEETFCTMGLAIRHVSIASTEVTVVALQDQGSPGDDGCDVDASGPTAGLAVLGYDCRIRDAGTVLGIADANRPDGTCGQGDQRG